MSSSNDGLDDLTNLGNRLVQRINAACFEDIDGKRVRTMSTELAMKRVLGEEIARGFQNYLKQPFLIKGGHVYPQTLRETSDLDIMFMRRHDEAEFMSAFKAMVPDLAAKGIRLELVDIKHKPLKIDGEGGDRFLIVGHFGTSRAATQVDITYGIHRFPKVQSPKRYGATFYNTQEPLLANFQSYESQMADKLVSIMRPDTSRWKDFNDVVMLSHMKLDLNTVAKEILHKMAGHYPSPEAILEALPALPDTMTYEFAVEKAAAFEKWAAKGGTERQKQLFEDVLCDARHTYTAVRDVLVRARIAGKAKNPSPEAVKKAFAKARAMVDQGKPVINLSDYRLKIGSDISPRFGR